MSTKNKFIIFFWAFLIFTLYIVLFLLGLSFYPSEQYIEKLVIISDLELAFSQIGIGVLLLLVGLDIISFNFIAHSVIIFFGMYFLILGSSNYFYEYVFTSKLDMYFFIIKSKISMALLIYLTAIFFQVKKDISSLNKKVK